MTTFIHYCLGLLFTSSLLVAWFDSDFPVYLFKLLQWLGWNRSRPNFWPDNQTMKVWQYQEWSDWEDLNLPDPVSHIMGCPVCMSFHLSFWVSVFFCCSGFWGWIDILPVAFSWPVIIHYCSEKLNK
jgi:hypothetical protein